MTLPLSRFRQYGRLMLLAALPALASGAHAQSDQDADGTSNLVLESLETADSNEDGQLTRAELTVMLDERFARMDRDGNGLVNADDAPRLARRQFLSRVGPVIEERDANGDSALSYSEYTAVPLENFDTADSDGDGSVEIPAFADVILNRSQTQN